MHSASILGETTKRNYNAGETSATVIFDKLIVKQQKETTTRIEWFNHCVEHYGGRNNKKKLQPTHHKYTYKYKQYYRNNKKKLQLDLI